MKLLKGICAVILISLGLSALAGCGSSTVPSRTSNSPARHASSAVTSPPNAAPSSPRPAQPAPEVVLSRVTYPWHWPNDVNKPGSVQHIYPAPPLPTLTAIGVGDHPSEPGGRPYNRISFTFTGAFPSYRFSFVKTLVSDPGSRLIPLAGNGALKVTFSHAQAHTASGQSSVVSQPPSHLGFSRLVSWAQAGDFDGVLTYGIGISWPIPQSNPQIAIRATEVEEITAQNQRLYTVAIDIDATAVISHA